MQRWARACRSSAWTRRDYIRLGSGKIRGGNSDRNICDTWLISSQHPSLKVSMLYDMIAYHSPSTYIRRKLPNVLSGDGNVRHILIVESTCNMCKLEGEGGILSQRDRPLSPENHSLLLTSAKKHTYQLFHHCTLVQTFQVLITTMNKTVISITNIT